MAAMKEGGEVGGSEGRKPKEKVAFGEDQVLFGLEAERVEPGEIVVAAEMVVMAAAEKRQGIKRRKENGVILVIWVAVLDLMAAFLSFKWVWFGKWKEDFDYQMGHSRP